MYVGFCEKKGNVWLEKQFMHFETMMGDQENFFAHAFMYKGSLLIRWLKRDPPGNENHFKGLFDVIG